MVTCQFSHLLLLEALRSVHSFEGLLSELQTSTSIMQQPKIQKLAQYLQRRTFVKPVNPLKIVILVILTKLMNLVISKICSNCIGGDTVEVIQSVY